MFDSLDEQMKQDDAAGQSPAERLFKWAAVVVISVLVFGGLYLAIQMMEEGPETSFESSRYRDRQVQGHA